MSRSALQAERRKLLHAVERLLEGPMVFLGFAWLVLLLVELIRGLSPLLEYASYTIWILFLIDFIIKLVLAPQKGAYLKRNWLTVISLLLPAFRVFRLLRVLRFARGLRGMRLVRVVSSVNRSMKSLAATLRRRGFIYVFLLTVLVTVGGAAGMYGIEKGNPGFESFGMALWWSAMRVITAGSEYWPLTPEGRGLAFLIAVFGYAVFGYVTATLATFFIGRDAEEPAAPVAGSKELEALRREINELRKALPKEK